jgi:beta-1,4-N-acetylglucosaminyltransferase
VASAGSGTILEGLSIGKKMVVVVNDKLMDNHQMEIASVMGQVCAPATLTICVEV